jgi:hypothetical protein
MAGQKYTSCPAGSNTISGEFDEYKKQDYSFIDCDALTVYNDGRY